MNCFGKILIAIIFLLIPSLGVCSEAQFVKTTESEKLLFEKINDARRNPLKAAEALGYSADQIIQDLPELETVLTKGTANLWYNSNLQNAAAIHAKDMIDNFYYSHASPNGDSYSDRIRAAGYPYKISGESIGILAFNSFFSPNGAVESLFENLLRDELNPKRVDKRNILNSEFQEIGISIQSGIWTIGKVDYNIVLVVCVWGTRESDNHTNSAIELFQLINQARNAPLAYAEFLGLDIDKVKADLPDLAEVLEKGIPPVGFNSALFWSAGLHTLDMITNHFYSKLSSNGKRFEERLNEIGYNFLGAGEIVQHLRADAYIPPADRAEKVFNQIFIDELDPLYKGERKILNPEYKEVGIGFGLMALDVNGKSENYYICSLDFGHPVAVRTYLTGRVFEDKDLNGLYTPGEGISGVNILIEKSAMPIGAYSVETVVSGECGYINVPFSEFAFIKVSTNFRNIVKSEILPILGKNQEFVIKVESDEIVD